MGCASSDLVEMIIKKHKTEIELAKKEIENQIKETPNKIISIVFKLMNGKTVMIPCFKKTSLFHVFLMLVDKAHDTDYSNIEKLNIYYNSVNITKNFNENSNKFVSDLNFTNDTPLVYINA